MHVQRGHTRLLGEGNLDHTPVGSEGENCADTWEENIAVRRNSKCKGPVAAVGSVYLQNILEVSVAGSEGSGSR